MTAYWFVCMTRDPACHSMSVHSSRGVPVCPECSKPMMVWPPHVPVKERERAMGMVAEDGFVLPLVIMLIAVLTILGVTVVSSALSNQRMTTNAGDRVEAFYMAEGIQAEVWTLLNDGAPLTRSQWYVSTQDADSRFVVESTADPLVVLARTQSTVGSACVEVHQGYALAAGPSDPPASRVAGTYSEGGCSA